MQQPSPPPDSCEPLPISHLKLSSVLPYIENLNDLIFTHRKDVSESLLSHKRTRLAKIIASLPDNATRAHALCLNDLPTAAAALGLSSLALACHHARDGKLVEAMQAADRGIVMLGPGRRILQFIEGIEKQMGTASIMTTSEEAVEDTLYGTILGNEEQSQISVPRHLSDTCAEVRADEFSIDAFRNFFKHDEPVVIRSCAQWKALSKWREVSYWRRYAHRMVPVELEGQDGKMKESFLPVHEVINAMLSGRRVYMAQHTLFSQIPVLFDDIDIPVYTQIGGGADVINAWMGSSSTGSKLHHDSADNILVQVVGFKTVVLIPTDDPVYAKGSNFSPVDVENPDYDSFPMFRKVTGKIVHLAPGDGLYIPAGHWHYVKARTSSISVNFWF